MPPTAHAIPRRTLLIQAAVIAGVGAAVLFLMPCSPLSIWGASACRFAAAPAAEQPADPPARPGLDFARDVVAASRAHPVLVDFNATWCGPCRALRPELERAAAARPGLALVPIDVDANRAVAEAQAVDGIPDVRLWRDGAEVARFVGFRAQGEIATWLGQTLDAKR